MLLLMHASDAGAQKFFNLTAGQVRTDSVLPHFASTFPLPENYSDSVYTVSLAYPEFVDMPRRDIEAYRKIVPGLPPAMPEISSRIVFDRKRPSLQTEFCPVVYRDGRYRLLVSFMLKKEARPVSSARRAAARTASDPSSRYAAHSVLASGRWAKIRVPSTGVYQLSESLIRQAGFSDINRVKVYGYGGNLRDDSRVTTLPKTTTCARFRCVRWEADCCSTLSVRCRGRRTTAPAARATLIPTTDIIS